MLENKSEEFDLRVRSLLEDAEVSPRPRSWRAVSRRLDAAQASTPAVMAGWRWAGLGLAFAAALVAGIFIFRDGADVSSDSVNTLAASVPVDVQSGHQVQSSDKQDPISIVKVDGSAASGLLAGNVSHEARTAGRKAQDIRKGSVTVGAGQEHQSDIQPAADQMPATDQKSAVDQKSALDQKSVADQKSALDQKSAVDRKEDKAAGGVSVRDGIDKEGSSDGSAARMLAMLAMEDSRRGDAEPVSVQFGGALSGNESHFISGSDHRAYMSSGESLHSRSSIEEKSTSSYDIPISFGAGVRFRLSPRFSLGTGLTYTFLGRSFTGLYTEVQDGVVIRSIEDDVRHKMHYLGIPVDAYFSFIDSKVLDFYGYAGGAMEFCLSNRYYIKDALFRDPVNTPQFSVGAGLGIQFKLSDRFGLYLDPGVRYYFPSNQPKSVRTDRPLMVNFEAGLRVNLQ